ncbi:MAG: phosphoadenosine phosphosulfate reductase family protein [Candidatus Heimdallarchaeum endolithica]|uniref:Phosphoadenosine phosphosulfate reductase family protein n=1 Tax=Candidatus Heimdallarchaeum endolithica TaxID=2876572 RepID=A0A9Y1BPH6_9ARCH|nr:MAG: phosphoadenosine phosphosulfate reductase family protein [Candidatus Heimdallarchaeum endolithica]
MQEKKKQKKKKNIPYLGKNILYFCDDCCLPIVKSNICPRCGKKIKRVPITPPYDVRPATKQDIKEILRLIKQNFGVRKKIFSLNDVMLLNHVGSEDQMDEIVYYGNIIGIRRYDLVYRRWTIKLNAYGLLLIEKEIKKNWVIVDDGAIKNILNGSNALIPGITCADTRIKKDNYIAILDKNRKVIAGGIAKIDEKERRKQLRGTYAKNYIAVKNRTLRKIKKTTWEEVIEANSSIINDISKESIHFIRRIKDELKLPVAVSFSGGKDSLVTLDLALKALPEENLKIFFIDTGIEFPQTVSYVKKLSKKMNFKDNLKVKKVKTRIFWNAFQKFGPPGRDYRYCCKFAKLAPIRELILQNYPDGKCISLVGQRRYESYARATADIWQNHYIPNQINVSPIQNWTALVIWLYIFLNKLPYNPLYEKQYERIGCWVCPSSNLAQFDLLKSNNRKLYKKLSRELEKWRKKKQLPKEYISRGLWRFKHIPQKIRNVLTLDKTDISIIEKRKLAIDLEEIDIEKSDCRIQQTTILGSFSRVTKFENLQNNLSMVGKVVKNNSLNFIQIKKSDFTVFLYLDGTFKLRLGKDNEKKLKNFVEKFVFSVLRTEECLNCKLCFDECKTHSLSFNNNGFIVDPSTCIQCGKCFDVCPIYTITHQNTKEKIRNVVSKINF